jgi:hypothetical protein
LAQGLPHLMHSRGGQWPRADTAPCTAVPLTGGSRSKQDAESVGSARTKARGKKWSHLEKSGPGWKKMDFTFALCFISKAVSAHSLMIEILTVSCIFKGGIKFLSEMTIVVMG